MKNIPSFNEYINEAATDRSQYDEIGRTLRYLEDLIQKEIGFKPKLTSTLKKGPRGSYMEITSEDVLKQLGPVGGAAFETARLTFTGGSEVMEDDSVMFTSYLSYTVPYGGSNGVKFIWDAVWYSFDESAWIVGRKLA
jgi:hypothetical protein